MRNLNIIDEKLTAVRPHPVTVSLTKGTGCLGLGSLIGCMESPKTRGWASLKAAISLSNCGWPYDACHVTLETATIRPPESRRVLPTRRRTACGATLYVYIFIFINHVSNISTNGSYLSCTYFWTQCAAVST